MKIFIANIGWMIDYKGQSIKDKISGGGSYSNARKHEVYNFQNNGGYCYGHVETNGKNLRLYRIDDKMSEEDKLSDVLVIWVSKNPVTGGSYIIGWYKNATVYSTYLDLKGISSERRSEYSYIIKAKAINCTLLPIDARTFKFKRGKGYLGQKNYCYLDSDDSDVKKFRKEVVDYVINYSKGSPRVKPKIPKPDVDLNKRIETAAVDAVIKYYQELGYRIIDRQKDNFGWDLDAIKGDIQLHLEVKGNASIDALARISCNEYKSMLANRETYRLCIVTNTLKSPQLYIFVSDGEGGWVWEEDSRLRLQLDEQIAAIGRFKIVDQ